MLKGCTKIIDDEFAIAVVSNQISFHRSNYQFKNFTYNDPVNFPPGNSFTKYFQKYLNVCVARKPERWKHAMRDVGSFQGTENKQRVTETKYFDMLETVCRKFHRRGYSHDNLMAVCADVCTFTRCASMRGLRSFYWAKYLVAECLLFMRDTNQYTDRVYVNLNEWLIEKVSFLERCNNPLSLAPIELSLEWVNTEFPSSAANSSYNYDSEDEKKPARKPLRI